MSQQSRRHRTRRARAALAAVVVAGVTLVPPLDRASAAPSACPAPFPIGDLTAAHDLEGLTVERGVTPQPFTAEFLGVIRDGIGPGLDMIVVEASSDAIDRAGGIWAGMSGSPVYAADGRLVGAVAYGLTWGSSPIAGITPAADMYKLLDGGGPVAAPAETVELPTAMVDQIVADGAATRAQARAGLSQLTVPLGISGMSSARAENLGDLGAQIGGTKVYAASRAPGQQATATLVEGGNVAAALSYGDVSAVGVGTVTAVCGNEALLFGHPFAFAGKTTLTAHRARALFVQPDNLGVPFKVANPLGVVGTVDQDRLAGLRTQIGARPDVGTIRGTFSTVGGMSRTSATRVAEPGFLPTAAAYHVLFNLDRVNDRIGPGTAALDWTVTGRRANGERWRMQRRDMVASQWDAAYLPAEKVWYSLERLYGNQFEDITIDRVTLDGVTTDSYDHERIVGVQIRRNGQWRRVDASRPLQLTAGSTARMRAIVVPYRSTERQHRRFTIEVPKLPNATGNLVVAGGGRSFFGGGGGASDFDGLLRSIRSGPSGDSIVARFDVRNSNRKVQRSVNRQVRAFTIGNQRVPVRIVPK